MQQEKVRIGFLDTLRAIAALLVVYSHLVGMFAKENFLDIELHRFVQKNFLGPLGLINDFGLLGVMVFFLISGYIITHVAERESRMDFALKRIFRIYPPLIVSVLIVAAVNAATSGATFPLSDYALSALLANFFFVPLKLVNGVTWTLFIEVWFYLLMWTMMPLLKRGRYKTLSVALGLIGLLIVSEGRAHGDRIFAISALLVYTPCLFMGQLLYFASTGKIGRKGFAILSFLMYLLLVKGMRKFYPGNVLPEQSYLMSFIASYFIFTSFMFLDQRIGVPRSMSFFARISYSLYLVHAPVGYTAVSLLYERIGYYPALVAGFVLATLVSWLMHIYVEEPFRRMARNVTRSKAGEQAS